MFEESFRETQYNFYNHWARKEGLEHAKYNFRYPEKTEYCHTARHPYGFVIDSKGNITRCWMRIGCEEERIQNISSPYEQSLPLQKKWIEFDKTRFDEECKQCKFLPICQNDCPRQFFDHDNHCFDWKFILLKRMENQIKLAIENPDKIEVKHHEHLEFNV